MISSLANDYHFDDDFILDLSIGKKNVKILHLFYQMASYRSTDN